MLVVSKNKTRNDPGGGHYPIIHSTRTAVVEHE